MTVPHQYIERESGSIITEQLFGDKIVNFFYQSRRENPSLLYSALTSARLSSLLGFINYDSVLGAKLCGGKKFIKELKVDMSECVFPPWYYDSPRKVFERQIRFWQTRCMDDDPALIAAVADSRVLIGSLAESCILYIKEKFFDFKELIGKGQSRWFNAFVNGDYAIFRLTPEKYHYNHVPVSGRVIDFFAIKGIFNPCNPGALVSLATPYSKNKRVVTIIDTDVDGGSRLGLVAMVEVVALMIGDIIQCYSRYRYNTPGDIRPGMFVRKGRPKSLFRPGSSTTLLFFQRHRISFSRDLVLNQNRQDASSRFSMKFERPMVETEVQVRSTIGAGIRK